MTTTFDAPPMCGAHTMPLRGRDQDRACLVTVLTRGDWPVVEGPPGSGKTALLRDLVLTARARGYVVYEQSGWVEPAVVRQMSSRWARQAEMAGPGTTPSPLIVVAWDDPPWTDAGFLPVTTAVVWALTRRACDGRPAALSASTMVSVVLRPLALAAVAELLTDRLGAIPGADLLALVGAAAGNPGAIIDLVDGLGEENLLDIRAGAASLVSQQLPRRAQARVQRQLHTASPPCRELVQLGSALPQPFKLMDVARLLDRQASTLLSAVEEALTCGLLVAAGEELGFSHPLVRQVVAQSLPMSVRSALRQEVIGLATSEARPAHDAAPANQGSLGNRAGLASLAQPAGDRGVNAWSGGVTRRTANRNVAADGWESLSDTEREIARLIATNALTNKQIATRLKRSSHTVNYHLRQIYRKLGINSRVELATLEHQAHPRQQP